MTLIKKGISIVVAIVMALCLAMGTMPFYLNYAFADPAGDSSADASFDMQDMELDPGVLGSGSSEPEADDGSYGLTLSEQSNKGEDDKSVDDLSAEEAEWDNANSWRYENGQLIQNPATDDELLPLTQYTAPTWNKSLGASYNYTADGRTINVPISGVRAIGVDVSAWQGDINWSQVKASGINFAILRIRTYSSATGTSRIDPYFIQNARGCMANGIPFGVYIYSYAHDVEGAKNEANLVLSYLNQAGINSSTMALPVYFDLEENSMASESNSWLLGRMATAFCGIIQSAGYQVGIYANTTWWTRYLTDSAFDNRDWHRWSARYPYGGNSSNVPNTEIWQFSSAGSVDGIPGNVDMNFSYVDTNLFTKNFTIGYSSHVSNVGWQVAALDGNVSGLPGSEEQLEAFEVNLSEQLNGGVRYKACVEGEWEDSWASDGEEAGTTGESKYVDAIQLELTGEVAESHDIYYRTYVAELGWLGWAKNGEPAGSKGLKTPIQAYQVKVVDKGVAAPGATNDSYIESGIPIVSYQTHVQNVGWQDKVINGGISGTSGKSLRLEGVKANLVGADLSGSLQYMTHVQNIGWQGWKSDGEMSGTSGQALRLEAIKCRLTGELAEQYDIYYRVHAQMFGWMGWAKNGQSAGTAGYGYRLEAIQFALVEKGQPVPDGIEALAEESYAQPFKNKASGPEDINYTTHVQNVGWQNYVSNGAMAGTSGQSLRLEGIKINLSDKITNYGAIAGGLNYRTHIQNIGWENNWKSDDEMSGTSGRSLRLEAIQISLTEDMADLYDVYYRVHAQNVGWMGWAKNGEEAGTAGFSYRLEGIQIVLVEKGGAAPGATYEGITQDVEECYLQQ